MSSGKQTPGKQPSVKRPPKKKASGKKPPGKRLGKKLDGTMLDNLYKVILSRKSADPARSHTAKLFSKGTAKIAQKVGEEAVEAVIEAMRGDNAALVAESSDLLYHLLVLWADRGVDPATVWAALQAREGISGLAEKAARRR